MEELVFSPSDFVAVLNQTLEFAYPSVTITGELANLRVSKGRWLYFDLKDDQASVKFFGTVNQLPGPLEEGMIIQVRGTPRLHQLYGFSVNVQFMQPVGQGSIKKAAALLEAKLRAEGLFDEDRKRAIPYPPNRVGLIASSESAAYHDFIKILNARWVGLEIMLADVQVQGEAAVGQVVSALDHFNSHETPVDVLIITRGGGSPEDMSAFSSEQVVRAVAASRIPTVVAIGHEVDISLAELASDRRASTPSNAAELLVPDKRREQEQLSSHQRYLGQLLSRVISEAQAFIQAQAQNLHQAIKINIARHKDRLELQAQLMEAFNPSAALKRGYALVRKNGRHISSIKGLKAHDALVITLSDGNIKVKVD